MSCMCMRERGKWASLLIKSSLGRWGQFLIIIFKHFMGQVKEMENCVKTRHSSVCNNEGKKKKKKRNKKAIFMAALRNPKFSAE